MRGKENVDSRRRRRGEKRMLTVGGEEDGEREREGGRERVRGRRKTEVEIAAGVEVKYNFGYN